MDDLRKLPADLKRLGTRLERDVELALDVGVIASHRVMTEAFPEDPGAYKAVHVVRTKGTRLIYMTGREAVQREYGTARKPPQPFGLRAALTGSVTAERTLIHIMGERW